MGSGRSVRGLTKGGRSWRLSLRVNYFRILFDFCFNLSYLLSLFLDCFRLFVYFGSVLSAL